MPNQNGLAYNHHDHMPRTNGHQNTNHNNNNNLNAINNNKIKNPSNASCCNLTTTTNNNNNNNNKINSNDLINFQNEHYIGNNNVNNNETNKHLNNKHFSYEKIDGISKNSLNTKISNEWSTNSSSTNCDVESNETGNSSNNNNNKVVTTPTNNKIKLTKTNCLTTNTTTTATITTTSSNQTNETRTRVLICTESFHPYTSGIARRFKEIIERLAKRGFVIHVVTGCKGCETWTNDLELKNKVTFTRLFAIEFKDKIDCALPFLMPQYGILREILKFKPNVIHCVEHTPAATLCAVLGKTLNIPIVWSSHTNLDYYIPLYIRPFAASLSLRVYQLHRRTFLNMSDYNMTVSTDFSKQLKENGIKKPVHIWKTGVDSESFNPSYRSHEMRVRMFNGHYSPDKVLLVSVGRLSPEKNFDFLLKILERFPQTFLCIVGGGPYKERLEPLFPPNQTHFMGFLQGEQLAAAYASADYFIYASISETFGQVYLEAMSSGTPVVAAEGTQMKEFFINGIHGYTWKPGNVESAVKALNDAIKNRNILTQNCRSNALNHSWNSAANQIAEVYTQFKQNQTSTTSSSTINSYNPLAYLTRLANFIKTIFRGIYYFIIWLYLMMLVLLFMTPFMNVAKPNNTESVQNNESPPLTTTTTTGTNSSNIDEDLSKSNKQSKENKKSSSKKRQNNNNKKQQSKNNTNNNRKQSLTNGKTSTATTSTPPPPPTVTTLLDSIDQSETNKSNLRRRKTNKNDTEINNKNETKTNNFSGSSSISSNISSGSCSSSSSGGGSSSSSSSSGGSASSSCNTSRERNQKRERVRERHTKEAIHHVYDNEKNSFNEKIKFNPKLNDKLINDLSSANIINSSKDDCSHSIYSSSTTTVMSSKISPTVELSASDDTTINNSSYQKSKSNINKKQNTSTSSSSSSTTNGNQHLSRKQETTNKNNNFNSSISLINYLILFIWSLLDSLLSNIYSKSNKLITIIYNNTNRTQRTTNNSTTKRPSVVLNDNKLKLSKNQNVLSSGGNNYNLLTNGGELNADDVDHDGTNLSTDAGHDHYTHRHHTNQHHQSSYIISNLLFKSVNLIYMIVLNQIKKSTYSLSTLLTTFSALIISLLSFTVLYVFINTSIQFTTTAATSASEKTSNFI